MEQRRAANGKKAAALADDNSTELDEVITDEEAEEKELLIDNSTESLESDTTVQSWRKAYTGEKSLDEDPATLERTKAKKLSMEGRERRDQEGGKRREGKEENEKKK